MRWNYFSANVLFTISLCSVLAIFPHMSKIVYFSETAKKTCPRRPRPISSSQSPDPLCSSFVNFLSCLLHFLHLSTSPFSNRCKIGNFAKLPLGNFLSPRISNFPAFFTKPATPTIFPLPYQPTDKFSSSQSPSSSIFNSPRTLSLQKVL